MSKTSFPHVPAIQHCRNQAIHGPEFGVGECLMQTEIAFFGESGFGGATAALGWQEVTHPHPWHPGKQSLNAFIRSIPRGFPIWFEGGSPTEQHPEGDGHITISAITGLNWSTDRVRLRFWGRCAINDILTWNKVHPLRLVGWSEDIGGRMIPYAPHSKDAR